MNRYAAVIKWVSILLILLSIFLIFRQLPIGAAIKSLEGWIKDLGFWGPVVFGLIYVVAVVLLFPASALTLVAGAIFGLGVALITVSLAATTGAALAFLISRYLARDWIARKLKQYPKFEAIDRAISEGGWKIVALLRLSPAVPFNLQNYLYGLTGIRFWPYVLTSWLAMLPGTFMYVYLGYATREGIEASSGEGSRNPAQWALLGVGLLATIVVTVYVTHLARRALRQHIALGQGGVPKQQGERPMNPPASLEALVNEIPELAPLDVHNRTLASQVHPPDWSNPTPADRYHLVVIGAGTAGLVTAAGAAGLGAKVALVEKKLMGGDCLNVGCVPSKALLRAARAAADVRDAGQFGVRVPAGVTIDFSAVMERMRRLRAQISPHDGARRFQSLGVDVFLGEGRFTGPTALEVDGQTLRFKKAVIATGARAASPAIPGLADAGYLTNETVFSLTELPRRLAVIGGGPIGCELAQAFARFGSQVFLLQRAQQILTREDQDAARIVETALVRDGVQIQLGCRVHAVKAGAGGKTLVLKREQQTSEIVVDAILVGVGRAPNVEGLNLEAAGVKYDQSGVKVNDRLRTTNKRIFAAGDICSRYQFTHAADAMARIVIQNALFLGRARASALIMPWCTYTDPEIAHVGLYEKQAQEQGRVVETFVQELQEADRAVLDGETEGLVKVHVRKGTDTILGATVVARHAGEMISELTLAIVGRFGLKTLARTVHPYPTQAEAIKKVADAYNRTRLTPFVQWLFRKWLSWTG